ncbi:MAG: GNAT family N-acetyltransferase [Candidatus Hodarchaeales archaeon]
MDYRIKKYKTEFEEEWLECLKETFYTSLYYDTILKSKPRYEEPILELITLHGNKVVAFLDIELIPPTEQLCGKDDAHCGQITLIGVHPKYRRQKIATNLLEFAINEINKNKRINRLEISFREDIGIRNWFDSMNFQQCAKYFEVSLSEDFFLKYGMELPFGIHPSLLSGFVDEEGFRTLSTDHPPEKTFPYLIMEKNL